MITPCQKTESELRLTAAPIAPTMPAARTRERPLQAGEQRSEHEPGHEARADLKPRDAAGRRVADGEGRDRHERREPSGETQSDREPRAERAAAHGGRDGGERGGRPGEPRPRGRARDAEERAADRRRSAVQHDRHDEAPVGSGDARGRG